MNGRIMGMACKDATTNPNPTTTITWNSDHMILRKFLNHESYHAVVESKQGLKRDSTPGRGRRCVRVTFRIRLSHISHDQCQAHRSMSRTPI